MAPSFNILYNPADHGAPNPLLPEEVFGHVDLETLANIHRYLCESELQEDIELATWIWENYLNGLWNDSPTAEIRTAQGFGKLDRAYRRVRSLTNKAQDKWPFFDRNFKQMSSATVRNNARGEAAPGIMYPIDRLQRKSHLTGQPPNGSITPDASIGPELQVPFGTIRPSRYLLHTQIDPRPMRQTDDPLLPSLSAMSSEPPNSEKGSAASEQPPSSVIPKYAAQDFFSESDGQAKPQSEPPRSNVPQIKGAIEQNPSRDEPGASLSMPVGGSVWRRSSPKPNEDPKIEPQVRDAGAGKVRGPNGRYLPRGEIVPRSKKTKKSKKWTKTRTSMRNVEKRESCVPKAVSEEPEAAPANDEDIFAHVQSTSPPPLEQEAKEQNGIEDEINALPVADAVVPPATDVVAPPGTVDEQEVREEEEVTSDPGPVPAYLLAAEAEAVPSNLDRLPPNSRKSNKRKSEPTIQPGGRKRGKHGGIVGRPRKSEQRKVLLQKETATDAEESPQMTTRRATRQSAAANLSTLIFSKPTVNSQTDAPVEQPTHTSKKPPKVLLNPGKPSFGDEDEVMGGVEEDASGTHEQILTSTANAMEVRATSSSNLAGFPLPQITDNHLLSVGLDRTGSPPFPSQPASRHQPYQSPYQSLTSPPLPTFFSKRAIENGAGSANPPCHVNYFARITTSNGGTMDLPIDEDHIEKDEVKMIKKYVKYNAEPGVVPVSYTQFRQIFTFAEQD